MKTRIISTEIWDDDSVFRLNIDTKLLYLILLTNPYIGQSRFYKINDRQLSTFSGLNIEQIQKCKKDLEDANMVFFKDNYVCITGYGFIECFYKGERNEIAKQKELNLIPKNIFSYFKDKLDTLSIPYQYPIDTTINHKSEIINNKLEIINNKSEIINEDFQVPEWIDKESWNEWLTHRKQRKLASYKELGLKKLFTQLENEFGKDTERLKKAIDWSISKNYQGIYEPKAFDRGKPENVINKNTNKILNALRGK